MKKLMMMMSAALLLTSCGLYNKYERPDVNTTGLIRDAVSDIDTLAVQDTASFGNLPWRSVFTDPEVHNSRWALSLRCIPTRLLPSSRILSLLLQHGPSTSSAMSCRRSVLRR